MRAKTAAERCPGRAFRAAEGGRASGEKSKNFQEGRRGSKALLAWGVLSKMWTTAIMAAVLRISNTDPNTQNTRGTIK